MPPTYVIGDIHGHLEQFIALLRARGIIDAQLQWQAGDARLWLLGDFFDRGPDGIGTIELVMRLQSEAQSAGGQVGALLGNHDLLMLAAWRFGEMGSSTGQTIRENWLQVGGLPSDLERFSQRDDEWLAGLPAMALVNDRLLIHADATFYMRYGNSVDDVNQFIWTVLHQPALAPFDALLDQFAEREMFSDRHSGGRGRARRMLKTFGGSQIIHGHTPIGKMAHRRDREVKKPYVYAGGLCVNVDGGIYRGGPGFVLEI